MRLKTYHAADMAAAIAAVRADLGGDALILGNRRLRDGVEVTAGVEVAEAPPRVAPAPTPLPASAQIWRPTRKPMPMPRRVTSAVVDRAEMLAWHGVPADLATKLLGGSLPERLQAALRFAALDLGDDAAPVLCVGPPGAGKTLTVVRLATRAVLAGRVPTVITTDGQRAGAVAQLQAFTKLLGLKLVVADTAAAVGRAVAARAGPVLIDTPGGDPFDPAGHAERADFAGQAEARQVLVLPAGLDVLESQDIAAAFAAAGATLLVATKTDISRRIGGVLAAGWTGLGLAEAGIGPNAADGLAVLTPGWLAERLLSHRLSKRPPSGDIAR